jgi:hypothetical protein
VPRCKREAGQAATEYVAVLLVVAAVLVAATATAIAAPEVPRQVVSTIRTGICIVAGDVCSAADAEARGLEPCVRRVTTHSSEDGLALVVREHDGGQVVVTERSDGRWTLRAVRVTGASAGKVLAYRLGPDSIELDGHLGGQVHAGKEWTKTRAQVERVLASSTDPIALTDDRLAGHLGLPEPDQRYTEGGAIAEFEASLDSFGVDLGTVAEGEGELLLGHRRTRGGGSSWYFRPSLELRALNATLRLPAAATAEYREGTPPTLVIRSGRQLTDEVDVEDVVTWQLETPEDRATVGRMLEGRTGGRAIDRAALRTLRDRIARDAIREHRRYRTTVTADSGFSLEVFGIGFDHARSSKVRRLVSAELESGGRTGERLDCLHAA